MAVSLTSLRVCTDSEIILENNKLLENNLKKLKKTE